MEQYKTDMSVDEVNIQTAQSRLIRVLAQVVGTDGLTGRWHTVSAWSACRVPAQGAVHKKSSCSDAMMALPT